jgi:hypothetical protein
MQRFFVLLTCALAVSACDGSIVGGSIDGEGRWNPNNPNNSSNGDGDGDGDGTSNGGGGAGAGGGDGDGDGDAPTTCEEAARTTTLVRRLSHVEYNKTLQDLFPSFQISTVRLAQDQRLHGFENVASTLNPSAILVDQYSEAAVIVSEQVGQNLGAFMPCASVTPDMACGSEMIAEFGRRAFRRPLTGDEVERYESFFDRMMSEIGFRAAMELTVQAMLQAPSFLYRIELGVPEDGEAIVALGDYEMANRLSYFLWQTMPDDELFEAAENGELSTSDQVAEQARRMLNDPRATDAIVDFHRQWLSFDRVLGENKDPSLYPNWNDSLRDAMREESDRFVGHLFENGSNMLGDLLTSRVSFANQTLADFYGVPAPGQEWGEVELPAGERAGILTRGSFLAGYAHTTNGSPPLRGVAILDRLLCDEPPPPPPSADTSTPVNDVNMPRTNRELFEERNAPAECQNCHTTINGIGYGFEHYDAMGAFRETDNNEPVDATGEVLGTEDIDGEYDGAIELSERLASSTQVRACMVRNYFRYAFAREPGRADSCSLTDFSDVLANSDGDIRELLVSIASSHDFMHRPSSE